MIRTKKARHSFGLVCWFKKVRFLRTGFEVDNMFENKLIRFVEGNPRSVDLSYVRWRSS